MCQDTTEVEPHDSSPLRFNFIKTGEKEELDKAVIKLTDDVTTEKACPR